MKANVSLDIVRWLDEYVPRDGRAGYVFERGQIPSDVLECFEPAGYAKGDVWPDDVDDWPVAPSIVLDPVAGTGTVGEALAKMQVGNEYPATFVGLDYSHHYLADLARERLGLKALAAWGQGIEGGDGVEALRALAAEVEGGQLALGYP